MANEIRAISDYKFGTLSNAAAIGDTTLVSAAFASLAGAFYSTTTYLPIVLHDPAVPAYEVVWITAHTASSTSATVVRGKEGSSARAWPSGTQWLAAPTMRDALLPSTRAALPTDAAVGSRAIVTDESFAVQRTMTGGWAPSVGVGVPSEFGNRDDGSAVPSSAVIVARGGKVTASTDGSGQMQVTYKAPFPNQTICATISWMTGGSATFWNAGVVNGSFTAAGFKTHLYAGSNGATATAGISLTFQYIALGY